DAPEVRGESGEAKCGGTHRQFRSLEGKGYMTMGSRTERPTVTFPNAIKHKSLEKYVARVPFTVAYRLFKSMYAFIRHGANHNSGFHSASGALIHTKEGKAYPEGVKCREANKKKRDRISEISNLNLSLIGISCFDGNAMNPHTLKENFSTKASTCEERPRRLEATSRQLQGTELNPHQGT
ncbi:hypothetical protein STEG23_023477, partial [Scotinomys teguina]